MRGDGGLGVVRATAGRDAASSIRARRDSEE